MNLNDWLLFISSSAILAVSPGPDLLYVMATSASDGIKKALVLVFGLTFGLAFHTAFTAFTVNGMHNYDSVIAGIQLFGAVYLTWLGVSQILNSGHKQKPSAAKDKGFADRTHLSFFLQGLVMNLTNPKVLLFFFAFFPSFSTQASEIIMMGAVFYITSILIMSLTAWLTYLSAGRLSRLTNNPAVTSVISRTSGVFLLMIALSVLMKDQT